MKKCRIIILKKVTHFDLIEKFENPILNACNLNIGDTFISVDAKIPQNFCESAWQNLYPYVLALASGGTDIFNGWMKNKNQVVISCNDGFRPVSFLIESIE